MCKNTPRFLDAVTLFCFNISMALTEKDLRAIGDLISKKIRSEVPALIKAAIRRIPTRDEAAADQDQVMGELQAIRQEHAYTQSPRT